MTPEDETRYFMQREKEALERWNQYILQFDEDGRRLKKQVTALQIFSYAGLSVILIILILALLFPHWSVWYINPFYK